MGTLSFGYGNDVEKRNSANRRRTVEYFLLYIALVWVLFRNPQLGEV